MVESSLTDCLAFDLFVYYRKQVKIGQNQSNDNYVNTLGMSGHLGDSRYVNLALVFSVEPNIPIDSFYKLFLITTNLTDILSMMPYDEFVKMT